MSNIRYCPPLSRKRGDIKSHSSVRPSVTKTLTLAITFVLLQIELWYLACVFFVTRPFRWYHFVTLTVTFDLLQGQICCRAGDHNSLNLLVLTISLVLTLKYIETILIFVSQNKILSVKTSGLIIYTKHCIYTYMHVHIKSESFISGCSITTARIWYFIYNQCQRAQTTWTVIGNLSHFRAMVLLNSIHSVKCV